METSEQQTDEIIVLRQLLNREQAFFDIENQQQKSFEKGSFDSIRDLMLTTKTNYYKHRSAIEQIEHGIATERPDFKAISSSSSYSFSAMAQRAYHTAVSELLKDYDRLRDGIIQLLFKYESEVEYCLLPALFSYFWSTEEFDRFLDLSKRFDAKYFPYLAKTLLAHQSFFIFASSAQQGAIEAIQSTGDRVTVIIQTMAKRSFLFPAWLLKFVMQTESPVDTLIDCVLTPVFKSPSVYGLLPPDDGRTFAEEIPKLQEHREMLNEFITNAHPTVSAYPSENNYSSILSCNEQTILINKVEADLIRSMSDPAKVPELTGDGLYQVPCKKFAVTVVQKKGSCKQSDEEYFESFLRELVIDLDVSEAGKDIIDTLESALVLHAGTTRLQFELRIDEFKRLVSRLGESYMDVKFCVKLLTDAYQQRMEQRKDTLSQSNQTDVFKMLALHNTQKSASLDKLQTMILFSKFEETNPFGSILEQAEELCTSVHKFNSTYKDIVQQFVAFAGSSITREQAAPFVYKKLTEILNIDVFLKYNPAVIEDDKKINDIYQLSDDVIAAANKQDFVQEFIENPSLMYYQAQFLSVAFNQKSVISIAENIDKALNGMVNTLSFKGYKEIGGDHWVPLAITLVNFVRPPNTFSVSKYLSFFLLELKDLVPVSQSVEYNASMIFTAAQFIIRQSQVNPSQ